jgi:membrane-bound inhibitor of C-type lysozyme
MVQFAGATQFMRVARSGSGARYTGGGRQFWEHQDTALINWGPGTVELQCPKR